MSQRSTTPTSPDSPTPRGSSARSGATSGSDPAGSLAAGVEVPAPDRGSVERFVVRELAGLFLEDDHGDGAEDAAGDRYGGSSAGQPPTLSSLRFRGGQAAADRALELFDVSGYAATRNEAYPQRRRGASGLSPYIRHGLLNLPRVWQAVAGGPARDVKKFRDELLWQEYARHWYARLGSVTARPVRRRYADGPRPWPPSGPWNLDMACLELTIDELEEDGWLVNQTRMWLASHWTVRNEFDWRAGEDYFFRHLLDGSRAANRLGWQWTSGIGSNRSYGFSRWQVEKRAPGLCADCELGSACPIDQWPDDPVLAKVDIDPLVAREPNLERRTGPMQVVRYRPGWAGWAGSGRSSDDGDGSTGSPEAVWLTAESLGADDPALAANPELPAVFVFDAPLLGRLRLSAKRLVFLVETLAELATVRTVELHVGDPVEVLAGRSLATTFAPVPGWGRRAAALDVVELHPWPWLRLPVKGSVASFSSWAKQVNRR